MELKSTRPALPYDYTCFSDSTQVQINICLQANIFSLVARRRIVISSANDAFEVVVFLLKITLKLSYFLKNVLI